MDLDKHFGDHFKTLLYTFQDFANFKMLKMPKVDPFSSV